MQQQFTYGSGRLSTVKAKVGATTKTVASAFDYEPFGPSRGFTYGNGVVRTIDHDSDGRPRGAAQAPSGIQNLTYTFNANDQMTQLANSTVPATSQTYAYDELGRLDSVVSTGMGNEIFDYDASGNRIRHTTAQGIATLTYATTSNRLMSWARPGATTRNYTYNSAGNPTAITGTTYTYDPFHRLRTAVRSGVTATYDVNALGQRIWKRAGATDTVFAYGPDGQLLAQFDTAHGWIEYLHADGETIVLEINGLYAYLHNDQTGRPEAMTNFGQGVAWRAKNGAFTRILPVGGEGDWLHLGFPGQYEDLETGTYYNGFRDYDPSTGRYLQTDPIGLAGDLNTYAYVGGNPIMAVDSLGLSTCLLTTVGPGGVRDHAAVYTSRGDGSGGPSLYDPAGSYGAANGGGSGGIVTGDAASIAKFEDFHNGQKVESTCKDTSQKEEESIINNAMNLPSAAPFQCSVMSSTALSGQPSFPHVEAGTFWPGNLLRQVRGP